MDHLFIWFYCYLQQSTVTWHGKEMVCEQVGEKKCRGWTHWMEEDKLHLVRQEYVRWQKNESSQPALWRPVV